MLSFPCIAEDLNAKLGEFYCGCSFHMPNTTLFFPSMQKQGSLCSVPLLYMLIFHQKLDSFRLQYTPQAKGTFSLWEAQRHSCRFTAAKGFTDSRTFPLLRGHSVNSNVPF